MTDSDDAPTEGDMEDAPFVCPGCYAIGGEPCAPDCVDAAIEREREYDSDEYDRRYPYEDEDDEPVPESQRQEPLQEAAAELALCQKRLERSVARLVDALTPNERQRAGLEHLTVPERDPLVAIARRNLATITNMAAWVMAQPIAEGGYSCRWCRELVETPDDEATHDFCEPPGPHFDVILAMFPLVVLPTEQLRAEDEVLCSACRTLHEIAFNRALSSVTHSVSRVRCPCGYDIDAVYGWNRGQVVQTDVHTRSRALYCVK